MINILYKTNKIYICIFTLYVYLLLMPQKLKRLDKKIIDQLLCASY